MMTDRNIQTELLKLVRNALWHKEALPNAYAPDVFAHIVRMARQQAVAALVADAMLKNNVQTNDDGAMEIMAILISHQRHAARIDRHVAMLARLLNNHQIPYLVFKGQTTARYYPQPSLRSTGDVDFYVPPSYYERAKQIVHEGFGVCVEDDHLDKHAAFTYETTRFELHHRVETFGFTLYQRRFDSWMLAQAKSPSLLVINEVDVNKLAPLPDVVVIFKHLFNHLLVEGVGLRQICDLALMIHQDHALYNQQQLALCLKQIGYYKAFKALGAALVRYIGLPSAEFPFDLTPADYCWADCIMNEVLNGGNFGKFGRSHTHAGVRKSLETALIAQRHCLKFLCLAPVDIVCLIPRRIFISFKKYV